MKTHILKSWPVYFHEIWVGKKTFEIRENDTGFEVGDRVVLKEFLCDREIYTGREIFAEITYLTRLLQKHGIVVFSIQKISCRNVSHDPIGL